MHEAHKTYPLELNVRLFQLSAFVSVNSDEMFSNYLYQSFTTKKFRNHFEEAAKKYISEFNLDQDSI